ncbi:BA14K family protein [Pseudohoeflea coraliihabitans]|uniref:Lectin-like protein BA14k n=1 Tax=Pseudohoeflea coraliihabitans TaxID=2860393 RepID=A0ABS6WPW1_9HYPH|nr:BA14K family protein [Pseudohoeflea sp. DP4N28-3]MBW3097110.1 BA14K family protein [Pseudohoeflea sp. DP4N28-3]
MLKFFTSSCAAAAITLSMMAPVAAGPVMPQKPITAESSNAQMNGVTEVRHRRSFHRHGKRGWYRGHRGYRQRHAGYRYHNGFWFPPAAFALGAIIGSQTYSGGVRPGYRNPSHVSWCYDRYRSYRRSDNTFQPYHGPRRQCRSPYY